MNDCCCLFNDDIEVIVEVIVLISSYDSLRGFISSKLLNSAYIAK